MECQEAKTRIVTICQAICNS